MILTKHTSGSLLQMMNLILLALLFSCNGKEEKSVKVEEDLSAKKTLQGTWINDIDGNVIFVIKGDTIYYNDSTSTPVSFYVSKDTMYVRNHVVAKYCIKHLDDSNLHIVNADGDDVELVKSEVAAKPGEFKGLVEPNQGRLIKKDTVVMFNEKRYHAYTQVNPTTYKVYKQSTNSDGFTVESVYYDNIVHIAVYDGQRKVYGHNITKDQFEQIVPKSYLSQAILSDIVIDGVSQAGVRFIAILSIPDSYTNYRVNIEVTPEGKKLMSL